MNLQEILKSLKKESKITFWLSLLPITLLVGILGQISMLSKYNAIVFFSWGQVLNDTAILMLQVIVFFLGILSAYIYYLIKPTKKEKYWSLIILFLFYGLFGVISIGFFKNIYIFAINTSFLLGYLLYLMNFIVGDRGKHPGKNDNYFIPIIFNIFVLAIVFLFGLILNYFYSFLYKNIEIKIKNENHKINYMNDKYILYSSGSEIKIIPNEGKSEFVIKNIIQEKKIIK